MQGRAAIARALLAALVVCAFAPGLLRAQSVGQGRAGHEPASAGE